MSRSGVTRVNATMRAALVAVLGALLPLLFVESGSAASLNSTVTRLLPAPIRTPELVARHGLTCETRTVRTEDGYLLAMHRIPSPGRPVVFLQHGFDGSSADWVATGPGNALAFLLHDAGYDVWMGNFRGNPYSKVHANLSTSDRRFWDFSFHEMGVYDVPTMLNYVLETSQQSDLVYLGFSQGVTAFLVTASLRPEYNAKVRAFVALSPVAFLRDTRSPTLILFAALGRPLGLLAEFLGVRELFASTRLQVAALSTACADGNPLQVLCIATLQAEGGVDDGKLDTFQQYDLGLLQNLARYGSALPPQYPLDKVTVTSYLYHGDNDSLATPKAVASLTDALTNATKSVYLVPARAFNYFDFQWARNVRALVYDQVMKDVAKAFAGAA